MSPVYTKLGMTNELNQAEIIFRVAQYTYFPIENRAEELYHDYVVLLSQDCDIAQDFNNRSSEGRPDMNGLLLFEAQNAETVFVERKDIITRHRRDRIEQNNDDRFHYLEACPTELDLLGLGFPALLIDFKRYFTISPNELYRQCASVHGAQRRARLASPYREHIQTRMAFYSQRVMLPVAHQKLAPQTPPRAEPSSKKSQANPLDRAATKTAED